MKKALSLRRFVPVALLLVLVVVCGTAYAYMFHRTQNQTTTFTPAEVHCSVTETFENNAKSNITVTNTGNIPAYLRVRLVTYWVDGEGNVAAKSSPTLNITPADGWIKGNGNTFYYSASIAPGAATPELFSGSITLMKDADGNRQVIDVFAEAIQAEPTKAVTESWNVTLDSDGKTIKSAP